MPTAVSTNTSSGQTTGASIFTKGYASATESVYNSQKIFAASGNGASMMDCFFNSMNSVALGQDAPKSVFEQRLELLMGHEIQTSGTMLGDYSNYFSTSSSPAGASASTSTSASATSASTTASTSTTTSAAASSTSGTTSKTALNKYTGRAASAKSVSEMMGFLA